ncbi:MAG: transcription/translation regulatory transformer protein RfaH [Porticoccaceae bacterium]|nr:transcription/translation regulatory transformer protein RfaH [Porticoccaceae bacterium]
MNAQWVVVMTKARQEHKAVTNLQNQGFNVYLPSTPRRDRFGEAHGLEPLFPGYCFCAAQTEQSLSPLRSTPGVLSVVRFGQQIAHIDALAIDRIRKAEAYLTENPIDGAIQTGDRVRIVDGPLAGLEGLASNTAQNRIEVLIEMLGQYQRLRCDRSQIVKA